MSIQTLSDLTLIINQQTQHRETHNINLFFSRGKVSRCCADIVHICTCVFIRMYGMHLWIEYKLQTIIINRIGACKLNAIHQPKRCNNHICILLERAQEYTHCGRTIRLIMINVHRGHLSWPERHDTDIHVRRVQKITGTVNLCSISAPVWEISQLYTLVPYIESSICVPHVLQREYACERWSGHMFYVYPVQMDDFPARWHYSIDLIQRYIVIITQS